MKIMNFQPGIIVILCFTIRGLHFWSPYAVSLAYNGATCTASIAQDRCQGLIDGGYSTYNPTSSNWYYWYGNPVGEWMQIDFAQSYRLSSISFSLDKNGDMRNLKDLKFSFSDDSTKQVSLINRGNRTNTETFFLVPVPTSAFVRITVLSSYGGTFNAIAELGIWSVTPCDSNNQCQNGATCYMSNGQYCQCPDRYTGTYCETALMCLQNNPCRNGATCTENGSNDVICTCMAGYTGSLCETRLICVLNNPCQNGAACFEETEDNVVCRCQVGYTGRFCQSHIRSTIEDAFTSPVFVTTESLSGDKQNWKENEGDESQSDGVTSIIYGIVGFILGCAVTSALAVVIFCLRRRQKPQSTASKKTTNNQGENICTIVHYEKPMPEKQDDIENGYEELS